MYYLKFIELIELILSNSISVNLLNNILINEIDCDYIYDSADELISDVYFTLKHYAIEEEKVNDYELLYLKSCLEGKQKYDLDEKLRIINDCLSKDI